MVAHHACIKPILQATNISKRYGNFAALSEVDFTLCHGEVHVLFGENGAGKSTLISVISGATQPTDGNLFFQQQEIHLRSVRDARELGISAVFQEFSLVPQMTVAENIFLGNEPVSQGFLDKKQLTHLSNKIVDDLGFSLDVNKKVTDLSRAEQQMVEIAKAFRSQVSVLILDEPTASLTENETNKLFKTIKKLTQQGVGIIYITHRIAEIKEIGDRVSVMRDGHYIGTISNDDDISEEKIVGLITGKKHSNIYPLIGQKDTQVIFEAKNLRTDDGMVVTSSITVHKGELVGLAGLEGSGKSDFGQACYGIKKLQEGEITIDGQNIQHLSLKERLKLGLIYLPSDRKNAGLMLVRNARENMSLVSHVLNDEFFIKTQSEKNTANDIADRLRLAPHNISMLAEQFSGGNQQKIMLARILAKQFKIVILDEPTVGVDVGARAVIYELMRYLLAQGVSIILISSDLPEILNLSHKVYVFNKGKIAKELVGEDITEERVLSYFF